MRLSVQHLQLLLELLPAVLRRLRTAAVPVPAACEAAARQQQQITAIMAPAETTAHLLLLLLLISGVAAAGTAAPAGVTVQPPAAEGVVGAVVGWPWVWAVAGSGSRGSGSSMTIGLQEAVPQAIRDLLLVTQLVCSWALTANGRGAM